MAAPQVPPPPAQIRAYNRGDRVEVSIREYGFEESYYPAFVVHRIPHDELMVQFRTLVEEDRPTVPLRQIVMRNDVRPMPLQIVVTDFVVGDKVDAHDRDGWWTGRVVEKTDVDRFRVYFRATGEVLEYRFGDLRVHQQYNTHLNDWTFKKL